MNQIARQLSRGANRSALLLSMTALLGACTTTDAAEPAARTTYGPAVALGNGSARAYVTFTDGAPSEVGFALTESALTGLPDHHTPGGVEIEPGHWMFESVLPLPADAPAPYRHLYLNWNPGGHEPPGIYDLPHFDFHFYWISDAERRAIDPADTEFEVKGARHPAAELQPAGYSALPVAIPFMGTHWVDPTSPELNGEPFTTTFLFGSWDGRVIFAEPMITRAFLESKPNFTAELPTSESYHEAGYYPTSYTVRWDAAAREYRVALTGLVKKDRAGS